jgi:hypothetical protein
MRYLTETEDERMCVARTDRRVRRTDGGEDGGRKIERTRTIVIAFFDTYFLVSAHDALRGRQLQR